MNEKISQILVKLKAQPFEVKTLDLFIQKVEIIEQLFDFIVELSPKSIDAECTESFEDLSNAVIGLTYNLEYVQGELSNLDSLKLNKINEKLHKLGLLTLSLSRMYSSVFSLKYLNILHACKALVKYETNIIKSLDMEIKIVGYKLNNENENY